MADNTLRDIVVADMLRGGTNGTRTPLGTASVLSSENVPSQGLGTNPYVMGHRMGAIGRNRDIASQNATMQLGLNQLMAESSAAATKTQMEQDMQQHVLEMLVKAGIMPSDVARLTGTPGDYSKADEVRRIEAQPSSMFASPPTEDNRYMVMTPHGPVQVSSEQPAGTALEQAGEYKDNVITEYQRAFPGEVVKKRADGLYDVEYPDGRLKVEGLRAEDLQAEMMGR